MLSELEKSQNPNVLAKLETNGMSLTTCACIPLPGFSHVGFISTEMPRALEPYISSIRYGELIFSVNEQFNREWNQCLRRGRVLFLCIFLMLAAFIVSSQLVSEETQSVIVVVYEILNAALALCLAVVMFRIMTLRANLLKKLSAEANRTFPQTFWSVFWKDTPKDTVPNNKGFLPVIIIQKTTPHL